MNVVSYWFVMYFVHTQRIQLKYRPVSSTAIAWE